jgi:hypothetical protein
VNAPRPKGRGFYRFYEEIASPISEYLWPHSDPDPLTARNKGSYEPSQTATFQREYHSESTLLISVPSPRHSFGMLRFGCMSSGTSPAFAPSWFSETLWDRA